MQCSVGLIVLCVMSLRVIHIQLIRHATHKDTLGCKDRDGHKCPPLHFQFFFALPLGFFSPDLEIISIASSRVIFSGSISRVSR